jgi:outer membrane biosynthesis protein TonB
MHKGIKRFFNVILIGLLTAAISLFAEPVPQNSQEPVQTEPARAPDDAQKPQRASPNTSELPDAPMPAQAAQQEQTDPSQTQNPGTAPSGAAAAKAAPAKGAPASRPVGAAIAPAKQRGHRSLLIKVGLVAGACVAVGSVVALSKASSAKPAGAP